MSPIGAAEAFERAPLLAERVGEGDVETVIARARAVLAAMTEAERVAHREFVATLGDKAIWNDYATALAAPGSVDQA